MDQEESLPVLINGWWSDDDYDIWEGSWDDFRDDDWDEYDEYDNWYEE